MHLVLIMFIDFLIERERFLCKQALICSVTFSFQSNVTFAYSNTSLLSAQYPFGHHTLQETLEITLKTYKYFLSLFLLFTTVCFHIILNHLFAGIPLKDGVMVIVLSAHILVCFRFDIASIMQPPKSQTLIEVEKVTFTTYRYMCFCMQKLIKQNRVKKLQFPVIVVIFNAKKCL